MGQTLGTAAAAAESPSLPYDLLVTIFAYGSAADLKRWAQVCRAWHAAANEDTLWKRLCIQNFGTEATGALQALHASPTTWKEVFHRWTYLVPPADVLKQTYTIGRKLSNEQKEYDGVVRMFMLGARGAGKSTFMNRVRVMLEQNGTLDVERQAPPAFQVEHLWSIGIDFALAGVNVGSKDFALQLWDDPSQAGRSFRRMPGPWAYRNTHAIMLAFSIADREQFNMLPEYLKEIDTFRGPDRPLPMMLVGFKCDLKDQRQVPTDEARKWAADHRMMYMETSNQTMENAETIVSALVHLALKHQVIGNPAVATKVAQSSKASKKSGLFGWFWRS